MNSNFTPLNLASPDRRLLDCTFARSIKAACPYELDKDLFVVAFGRMTQDWCRVGNLRVRIGATEI